MLVNQGRWVYDYLVQNEEGQSFDEIKQKCRKTNSKVRFLKEVYDSWYADWLVTNEKGPKKEIYIGLDPESLPRACTAEGLGDLCEGLLWLDGSPFERRAASFGVETNGKIEVGCFILTVNSSTNQTYIQGMNDCDVKRSASCISDCLLPRCPIPRSLENGQSHWSVYNHVINDIVRFVHRLSLDDFSMNFHVIYVVM